MGPIIPNEPKHQKNSTLINLKFKSVAVVYMNSEITIDVDFV